MKRKMSSNQIFSFFREKEFKSKGVEVHLIRICWTLKFDLDYLIQVERAGNKLDWKVPWCAATKVWIYAWGKIAKKLVLYSTKALFFTHSLTPVK